MSADPRTDGRVPYLAQQRLARIEGRPTRELLTLYALEGILARLAVPAHRDRMVLKGGILLAAFDMRRPTRDIDVNAGSPPSDLEETRALVIDIASTPQGDGLQFDPSAVVARRIRGSSATAGVRVGLMPRLYTACIGVAIDVTFGDPIRPAPQLVQVPRLLGSPALTLWGYPLVMVIAEKLVTVLERGVATTRWRDLADIHLIGGRMPVDALQLAQAMEAVAAHRSIAPGAIADVLAGLPEVGQSRWATWRRRQGLDQVLPERLADVVRSLSDLADPILVGDRPLEGRTWHPGARGWVERSSADGRDDVVRERSGPGAGHHPRAYDRAASSGPGRVDRRTSLAPAARRGRRPLRDRSRPPLSPRAGTRPAG